MITYLPWLLLLVRPVMMIVPRLVRPVMLLTRRGRGGGKNTDRDMCAESAGDRVRRSDDDGWASAQPGIVPAGDRVGDRIAQLEREVADLRAAQDHPPGFNPTGRR
jgi:hypothetical protein